MKKSLVADECVGSLLAAGLAATEVEVEAVATKFEADSLLGTFGVRRSSKT